MTAKKIQVLGIIPARGGSKSIPYKNIADVGGKPLIYYTIREAKKSKLLDAFIVSTDDPKIAAVAKKYGADVPFLRPAKISGDRSIDIEFMRHALDWVKKNRGWEPEILVNLRPTSPLRTAEDINKVIEVAIKNKCSIVKTISL
ncbi:MAG: acylneuraminate cytidylyltransferase family protein, partial [Patescibacteria group bacterium]